MELIIVGNCRLKNEIMNVYDNGLKYLNELLNKINIQSLRKIVVTDYSFDNYQKSVREISKHLCNHINLANDGDVGAATVISGINETGEFEQIVFYRGDIFLSYCEYFLDESYFTGLKSMDDRNYLIHSSEIAFECIIHEIGHVIERNFIYKKYNYFQLDKQYNLVNELDEYIISVMLIIWSEYYAQRFMYSLVDNYQLPNNEEIIESVENCEDRGFSNNLDTVKKILYWFVLYISYYHKVNEAIPIFNDLRLAKVCLALMKVSSLFSTLYYTFTIWDFDEVKAKLKNIYIELYITLF